MRMLSIPALTGAMAVVLALIGSVGCGPASQPPSADRPRGQAMDLRKDDILAKDGLEADGVTVVGEHVVFWIPRGAIGREEASKLLDEYQRGIGAAKKKLGRPDWNYRGDRRIHYYFPDGRFISHATDGNCAFIPLWRVRERKSPWLHEALHLLLNKDRGDRRPGEAQRGRRSMPLWLQEGMATALAIEISLTEGLEHYTAHFDVPADQLDALAARALREAPSPEVLATIGGPGRLQELFGPQRRELAAPFYSGSASFVRFIANRHGYEPLLEAIGELGREHEILEWETGESLDSMKAAWLEQIGY